MAAADVLSAVEVGEEPDGSKEVAALTGAVIGVIILPRKPFSFGGGGVGGVAAG